MSLLCVTQKCVSVVPLLQFQLAPAPLIYLIYQDEIYDLSMAWERKYKSAYFL